MQAASKRPNIDKSALLIVDMQNDFLHRVGSLAFGLAPLRQQLLLLFMSKSIQTDIIDSLSNWRGFLGAVLNDLAHRPIRLPDNVETMRKGPSIEGSVRPNGKSK
jgi:hypothetical protein